MENTEEIITPSTDDKEIVVKDAPVTEIVKINNPSRKIKDHIERKDTRAEIEARRVLDRKKKLYKIGAGALAAGAIGLGIANSLNKSSKAKADLASEIGKDNLGKYKSMVNAGMNKDTAINIIREQNRDKFIRKYGEYYNIATKGSLGPVNKR